MRASELTDRAKSGANSTQFFSTYRGMAELLHRFQHACHTTLGTVTLAFASRSSDAWSALAPSALRQPRRAHSECVIGNSRS